MAFDIKNVGAPLSEQSDEKYGFFFLTKLGLLK